MYHQIIFALTNKVHHILKNNPGKDIRDLIGQDTFIILRAASLYQITSPSISFASIQACTVPNTLRNEFKFNLKECMKEADATLGLLFMNDTLLAYYVDESGQLCPNTTDLLLILYFVLHTPSLHSYSPSWLPICLPNFNPNGFLHAYVTAIRTPSESISATATTTSDLATTESSVVPASTNPVPTSIAIPTSIHDEVVAAAGSDSTSPPTTTSLFPSSTSIAVRSTTSNSAVVGTNSSVSMVLISTSQEDDQFSKLHNGRLLLEEGLTKTVCDELLSYTNRKDMQTLRYMTDTSALHYCCQYRPVPPLPAQHLAPPFRFPVNSMDSQEWIWSAYQRIYVCLLHGTSAPEVTLLDDISIIPRVTSSTQSHRTMYMVAENGMTFVGMKVEKMELFALFPIMPVKLACECTQKLLVLLSIDSSNLFQTTM